MKIPLAAAVFCLGLGPLLAAQEPASALPSAAAQTETLRGIRDVYKDDYAKTKPEERVALARKLLNTARETGDRGVRFVMCREAADLAAQAGDPATVYEAVEDQVRVFPDEFVVDGAQVRMAALSKAATPTPDTSFALADACLRVADVALSEGDLDSAAKALNTADAAARRTKAAWLSDLAAVKAQRLGLLRTEHDRVTRARKVLEGQPDDPEANLAVGRYYCFFQGDWERGIPYLIKGKDPKLAAAAKGELTPANTPQASVEQGNLWWDAGDVAKERALRYYQNALPNLHGYEAVSLRAKITPYLKASGFCGTYRTAHGGPWVVSLVDGALVIKEWSGKRFSNGSLLRGDALYLTFVTTTESQTWILHRVAGRFLFRMYGGNFGPDRPPPVGLHPNLAEKLAHE